ncbi:hypoxanthine phosphoribosyltransferase [Megalodesulfovibrio gigas]|uniref:Hypoxanthine phosphoribosyltransferase n=1 Tax=Megalodesulfovibrio gigas (strain ATCC 19364 / DSM 1382 / NCIMB 9332 / VKM B-1759) TaxID=1121448 RepID=T2GFS3_MEGG1|nr:hypoxanthine phosphoribosyltransferase [Megalodesulfovibrio gigas]AGW15143.1 putative hypoxanthine phosphoribosyltransferase [Megalodesulfovibrio gigas DSM 1382 = ATCC 19364]
MSMLTELISREQIAARIRELGETIRNDYNDEPLVTVCVLKGAVIFFADLLRAIDRSTTIDFMRIASYGCSVSRETNVRLLLDLETNIAGKHVLIVEDIIDTGHSMRCVLDLLATRNPASLAVCTLLDKRERREVSVDVSYAGFVVQQGFVVGYGLDFAEDYRHLDAIHILDPGA